MQEGYLGTTSNAGSSLIARYIKEGVKIGGITGTFKTLDTSDANATAEDILVGKTAYVDGKKIMGIYAEETDQKYFEIYYDSTNQTANINGINSQYLSNGNIIDGETEITIIGLPKVVVDENGDKFSVTGIGISAFLGCTSLQGASIPNSVTIIGGSAFAGCTPLKEIKIENSEVTIGNFAFENCPLTSIYTKDPDIFNAKNPGYETIVKPF